MKGYFVTPSTLNSADTTIDERKIGKSSEGSRCELFDALPLNVIGALDENQGTLQKS
jgi:hypothetical protein